MWKVPHFSDIFSGKTNVLAKMRTFLFFLSKFGILNSFAVYHIVFEVKKIHNLRYK